MHDGLTLTPPWNQVSAYSDRDHVESVPCAREEEREGARDGDKEGDKEGETEGETEGGGRPVAPAAAPYPPTPSSL